MLKNVNLLYLGCTVLLIVDLSYLSRFWTQFEAWLSMRHASWEGLQPDDVPEVKAEESQPTMSEEPVLASETLGDVLGKVKRINVAGNQRKLQKFAMLAVSSKIPTCLMRMA